MSTVEVLKEAVARKLQVTAVYDGYAREFCPHGIGWKRARNSNTDEHNVFAYQFAGGTSKGPVSAGGEWKCFRVDGLSSVATRAGKWHTAAVTRRATCIDEDRIELEVSH